MANKRGKDGYNGGERNLLWVGHIAKRSYHNFFSGRIMICNLLTQNLKKKKLFSRLLNITNKQMSLLKKYSAIRYQNTTPYSILKRNTLYIFFKCYSKNVSLLFKIQMIRSIIFARPRLSLHNVERVIIALGESCIAAALII